MKFKIFAFFAFFSFFLIPFKPFSTLGASYPPYKEVFDIADFNNWDYGVFVNDKFYSVIDSQGDSTGTLQITRNAGSSTWTTFEFNYYGGLGDYYYRIPNRQCVFSFINNFGFSYHFPSDVQFYELGTSSFALPYPAGNTYYCIYDEDFCYFRSSANRNFSVTRDPNYNTMTSSQFNIWGYSFIPFPPRAELYGSNFYTFHINLFDRVSDEIILNDSVIVDNFTSNWTYSNPNYYFSPIDFPYVVRGLSSTSGSFYFVDSHSLLYVSEGGGNFLKAPASSSPPAYTTDFDLNNINLDSLSNTFSPFISRIMALSWGSLALIWILPIATIIVAFLWKR